MESKMNKPTTYLMTFWDDDVASLVTTANNQRGMTLPTYIHLKLGDIIRFQVVPVHSYEGEGYNIFVLYSVVDMEEESVNA